MATRKILANVDLAQNELQNAALQNLSADPATGVEGQKYFNTTTHKERIYSNGAWQNTADAYSLPAATATARGGIRVGSHLNLSDTDKLNVDEASTTQKGVIELATDSEASTGTDTTRAITPKQLKDNIDAAVAGGVKFIGAATATTTAGTTGTPFNPASKRNGDEYKVIAGTGSLVELTVNTGSGTTENAKVGDTIICTDATNNYWVIIPSGDEPSGTVTSVATGTGLTGGPITSSGTISHADIETTSAVATAALKKITTDGIGHIVTTADAGASDIAGALGAQNANKVLAGPASGSDATPTFRALAAADIPSLGNIDNAGKLTDTAAAAASGDYVVIRDASNNKVQSSTLDASKIPTRYIGTNPALTASGGQCTWEITHGLGTHDVICSIREVSTGAEVYCEVIYSTSSTPKVTVKINSTSNISAGAYKAVVIG